MWHGDKSRKIKERVVVEGDLVLVSPAHFGCGDSGDQIDMPLLVDPYDGKSPLLTGASIAGALRNYLRTKEVGFLAAPPDWQDKAEAEKERQLFSTLLFGAAKGDDEGTQSPLVIDDSIGCFKGFEVREGVKINPKSRTAEKDALYNVQLWQAGTVFPLRFELVIREKDDAGKLKQALATALNGFSDGITLGARKRRGFGQVGVRKWRVKCYDMTDPEQLLDWLANGTKQLNTQNHKDIFAALGVSNSLPDHRHYFEVEATFWLDGSLLIRGTSGQDDHAPDMVHLHSFRNNNSVPVPVVSGTSLAGALRSRALKIANTIGRRGAVQMINDLFGMEMRPGAQPAASRLVVEESVIEQPVANLVQSRVSIDRFTGGARDTALFDEQPIFNGSETQVRLRLRVLDPTDSDVGLMLLLLKDLWTGDLPLGGEISVGRGRLKGKCAQLYLGNEHPIRWSISVEDTNQDSLAIEGDRDTLQKYVDALCVKLLEENRNAEKD